MTGEVGWWFRTLESKKDLGSIPYCALSGREHNVFVFLVEIYVVQSYIFLIGKMHISGELTGDLWKVPFTESLAHSRCSITISSSGSCKKEQKSGH